MQELLKKLNLNGNETENKTPFEQVEKQLIQSTLRKYNGNRSQTATELGINKTTLWRKMKKYKL
ncbi:MAG: hypothetical protein M5T52_20395 [Ignavibacteriaceae bacterium]|nr:hypothetical protein [Ignavibacteriaceae bacterium]